MILKADTMCGAGSCCSRSDIRGRPGAGVDDADTYGELCEFVRVVSEGAPVTHFVVHCRKAILGLDPGANRSIPPLRRGWAFALRRDFPHLRFSVNGQVKLLAPAPAKAPLAAAVLLHIAGRPSGSTASGALRQVLQVWGCTGVGGTANCAVIDKLSKQRQCRLRCSALGRAYPGVLGLSGNPSTSHLVPAVSWSVPINLAHGQQLAAHRQTLAWHLQMLSLIGI